MDAMHLSWTTMSTVRLYDYVFGLPATLATTRVEV